MSGCILQLWRLLRQPRVYFTVEPVLLVFMFAQFLSYSSLQVFLHSRMCDENPNCTTLQTNNTPCGNVSDSVQQKLQEETSHWLLYINILTGTPTILLSVFYGSTSDIIGRRLFIVLPTFGAMLNIAIILVVTYLPTIPTYVLLIGAVCSGIFGNFSVINFACFSYASDVSSNSGRTRRIGILEAMTYLGATLSLVTGGAWVQQTDSFVGPFWCIFACYTVVLIYAMVALPESLKLNAYKKRRTQGGSIQYTSKLSQCGRDLKAVGLNLLRFFKLLFTNWKLTILIVTFFVVEINFLGITDVVIIYALGKPLCWEFELIGYFLAAKVFLNGVVCLVVLPILTYLKVHDAIIVLVGLFSGAAALVTMGVATQNWTMYLVPAIGALRGCVVPCLRAMLSKEVSSDKLGVVFSGVGVIEASCTLLASIIYNALFPVTLRVYPGLCFLLMAAALIVPFVLILFMHLARNKSGHCCSSVTNKNSEKKPLLNHS